MKLKSIGTSPDRLIALILLAVLLGASLWIVAPFITALFWASILAFATWPAMTFLTGRLKVRPSLAAGFLVSIWVLIIAVPVLVIGASLPEYIREVTGIIRTLSEEGIPSAPAWLHTLPWAGEAAVNSWNNLEKEGGAALHSARPYLIQGGNWLLGKSAVIFGGVVEICLSLVLLFFFYRDGPAIERLVRSVLDKLVDGKAQHYQELVACTVQRVVNGVIGTAAAQGVLAWIGFAVAGVPGAFLLGVLVFFLSFIPMAPPLAWIPTVAWFAYQGNHWEALLLGIWCMFIVSGVDNVLKPYLISRGGTLPLVVVLIGVFGGILAFGFMGLFLGPTVLAVVYSLISDWTQRQQKS